MHHSHCASQVWVLRLHSILSVWKWEQGCNTITITHTHTHTHKHTHTHHTPHTTHHSKLQALLCQRHEVLLSHSSCQHPQSVNDLTVEHVKGSRLGLEDKALLGEGGAGRRGAGGGGGEEGWRGRGGGPGGGEAGGGGDECNRETRESEQDVQSRVSSLLCCTTMRKIAIHFINKP